jgi:hypothetical protein
MFKANKIRPRLELYANHRELLMEVILLTILHSIHDMTISDEFCDPTDGHFAVSRVGELLVVSNQMLLVPRIFFHPSIVVDTLKHHLTEAIVVRQIGHLGIDQFAHQLASLRGIMNLHTSQYLACDLGRKWSELTIVHRLTPYLTMRSFVMGAEICVM